MSDTVVSDTFDSPGICPGEVSIREVGPGQVSTTEVCFGQYRSCQVCLYKVGCGKVGITQV